MIAKVIPIKKLPKKLCYFDYKIPPGLKIKKGMIVKIPWRNQIIFGLVKKITNKPENNDIKLKDINSKLSDDILISNNQEKLIDNLNNQFLLSKTHWWKMILPNIPQKKSKFNIWLSNEKFAKQKIEKNVNKARINGTLNLIIPDNLDEMYAYVVNFAKNRGNKLILCPEISQIEKIISYLPQNIHKRTAVIHKKLSKSEYFNNYKKILNGKANLVIGTRLAAFAPFVKLDKIVVFKSEDYSFKQENQNPRFWIHDIIYNLQKIWGNKVVFLSLSPRIENYTYLKKNRNNIINLQNKVKMIIVDLGKEFQINNYTYISWQLEQEIKNSLKNKKKIFLLLNKKGLAKKMICRDCGFVPKCEKCNKIKDVLNQNQLFCFYCRQVEEFPASCPNCHGQNLSLTGLTNQTLAKTLQNIFPSTKIQYIDLDNNKISKNAQIVVGTKYALNNINSKELGLVAIVAADQEFTGTDFNNTEHGYALLNNTIRLNTAAKIILQTFEPENYIYQYLKTGQYHKFWIQEMKWRKKLNYPPYKKIIKIQYSDKNEKNTRKRIIEIYNLLNKTKPEDVELFEPFFSNRIINNKYLSYCLIRYTDKNILEWLEILPDDIIIDKSPYSVF